MNSRTPTSLLLAALTLGLAACGARDARNGASPASGDAATTASPAAGLVANGGFENGDHAPWTTIVHANPDAYQFELDGSRPHTGEAAMRIVGDGSEPWGGIVQGFSPADTQGARLRLSAMARGEGMAGGIHLMANFRDGPMSDPVETDVEGLGPDFDWRRIEMDFQVPAGVSRVEVGLLLQGAGTLWLDDIEVRPVP